MFSYKYVPFIFQVLIKEVSYQNSYRMFNAMIMAKTGDLCETKGELTVEWKIKDFSTLVQSTDVPYESRNFTFLAHLGLSGFTLMA